MRSSNASNGDNVSGLNCKVSIRIIDFNTSRGTGCHQHAMGHGWERYMDAQAFPLLRKQAARFLNWDLNTRVGAPFSNFYSACNSNGSQLTDCIVWDSQIGVRSGASARRLQHLRHVRRLRQRATSTRTRPARTRTTPTRPTRWCCRRASTTAYTTARTART